MIKEVQMNNPDQFISDSKTVIVAVNGNENHPHCLCKNLVGNEQGAIYTGTYLIGNPSILTSFGI